MECGIPVKLHCANAVLVLLAWVVPVTAIAERTVVLVTSETCPITALDILDIRKAYLGVAVSVEGRYVRPLRLHGSDSLNDIFFQSIVAMSQKSYERRVLSLALKFGTPRPEEFADLDSALDTVRRIECSVVYSWAVDLVEQDGIKTVKILWRGE